jgi:serine protein kinase
MGGIMAKKAQVKAQTLSNSQLHNHCLEVKQGHRRFENAFQGVARLILETDIQKVVVNARTTYDFNIFRNGKKHVIGMYDEINSFVSYVKDAAEGGSSKEMAFVLVGEPGNGKTFFVEFLCAQYRIFLAKAENRKYTFRFKGMQAFGHYGRIDIIESQTYEDPMILAMNLFDDPEENRSFLSSEFGFDDAAIETLYDNYRPLGACSGYIWNDIRTYCDGDLDKMLAHVDIIPVPLTKSPHRPSTCWAKSPFNACCISPTPTTPTALICAAAPWPGWPAAAFTLPMKSTKTKRTWCRSTWG